MKVLIVDDEPLAREELHYLPRRRCRDGRGHPGRDARESDEHEPHGRRHLPKPGGRHTP